MQYKGEFKHGEFDGHGEYRWGENEYVGMFMDGRFHGLGTLISDDLSLYHGEFEYHKYHGEGFYESEDGHDKYEG